MTRLSPRAWAWLRGERVCDVPGSANLLVREQVAGLAYYRLVASGYQSMSDYSPLQREYRATAAANLRMLRTLKRILARCGPEAERVMVLPGAALLPLYPDLGCRSMEDVDLLLRKEDFGAVTEALRASGLRQVPRHCSLWTGEGLMLDLHEDPLNADRVPARRLGGHLDVAAMFRQGQFVSWEGMRLLVPGRWDQILYTAAHAVRHGYSRLTWFLDLDLLLGGVEDWTGLRAYARRCGLTRPLVNSLYLLRSETGMALPEGASQWLEQEPPGRVERILLARAYLDGGAGEWGDALWSFGIPSVGPRVRFLLATAFPRSGVLMQVFPRLPQRAAPVAYLMRIGQLLWRTLALGVRMAGRWFR